MANAPSYEEIGTPGLNQFAGWIRAAYATELTWPSVQPLYNRLRRSDPEISSARLVFTALSRACTIDWELPDNPTDGDKQAQEFAQTVMDDMEGGYGSFLETLTAHVPFLGWGWWEVVPGVRSPSWRPPDSDDDWRSEYEDGRIGIRRLAWRDHSSFSSWDLTNNGRLKGMIQQDTPHPSVNIPLNQSLHITFGDANNPEGLAPLEAVWRLERVKYALEVIQGIGFEHSAGYLDVTADQGLTPGDEVMVKRAAKNVMTAQEGNYAAWPKGVRGELKDVPFSAATAILESIRYYGLLKLQVFLSQWIAIASTAGTGAYSAMNDASSMFLMVFNSMMEGFAKQADAQIGRRLFEWNSFPGMTARPRLVITPVEKNISLVELGTFLGPLKAAIPLGPEDYVAIRRRSGFLPETLPEEEAAPEPPEEVQPEETAPEETTPEEETPEPEETEPTVTEEAHVHDERILALLEDEEPGVEPVPFEKAQAAAEMALKVSHYQNLLIHHPELLAPKEAK